MKIFLKCQTWVNALILGLNGSLQAFLSIFIIHLMNLIDALQTNLHILQRIEEVHQLLHRRIELSALWLTR